MNVFKHECDVYFVCFIPSFAKHLLSTSRLNVWFDCFSQSHTPSLTHSRCISLSLFVFSFRLIHFIGDTSQKIIDYRNTTTNDGSNNSNNNHTPHYSSFRVSSVKDVTIYNTTHDLKHTTEVMCSLFKWSSLCRVVFKNSAIPAPFYRILVSSMQQSNH